MPEVECIDRSIALMVDADALLTQFRQGGPPSDLEEAIALNREALELQVPPHPQQSNTLNNLAKALWTRFLRDSRESDLEEVIILAREALKLPATPHLERSNSLNILGLALEARYEEGDQQIDIDEAISFHREALALRTPPHLHRIQSLKNLSNALWTRSKKGDKKRDLDEVISLDREVLELQAPPHPGRRKSVNNLANSLLTRFEQGDEARDLNEAIKLYREALEPANPDQCESLSNLGNALRIRFERALGGRSDLDEAIIFHREALEMQTLRHPNRSYVLTDLADELLMRFHEGGQKIDLDESILLHKKALELRPPPHPDRPSSLIALAEALETQFLRQGRQPSDLIEAIALSREALELRASPHPDRLYSLKTLANHLLTYYWQEGQKYDIDEAISLYREALELQAPSHRERPIYLNNLANALRARFKLEGNQQQNLDEAISLHRQALELCHSSHPTRPQILEDLAKSFLSAYSESEEPSIYRNPANLQSAMSSFSAAFQTPAGRSRSMQFNAARDWSFYAELHNHSSATEAYDMALQILPELTPLSLDIQARYKTLTTGTDGLTRRAALYAIQNGSFETAIEYLEAGRVIFWSKHLHLRSPLGKLRELKPELANRLRDIATQLEQGSHRAPSLNIADNQKRISLEHEAYQLERLNEEWTKTIDDVRHLDGFENFLLPHRFSSLQNAAIEYPVVFLVASGDNSSCLVMTAEKIHHISIPNFKPWELVRLTKAATSLARGGSTILRSSIDGSEGNSTSFPSEIIEALRGWIDLEDERGGRLGCTHISSDDIFRSVLKRLWTEVVKPVIDCLNIQKSKTPRRVQWCPTGQFTSLPVHAAGCYDNELKIECASDYIISSYTASVATLLTPSPTTASKAFKMMAVIQSCDLSSTKKELEKIERHVSSDSLIRLGVPGAVANVEGVASRLSDASIVHFACHGKQDRVNPLNSGLKLEDGLLTVSRIMKEATPNGTLAFLCACETAMGDTNIPDEAMNLGASLLFSGFPSVVATMWKMKDADGPTIADTFYEELFQGKPAARPDTTRSAQALHVAVNKLRSSGVGFHRWVPFIHMGK